MLAAAGCRGFQGTVALACDGVCDGHFARCTRFNALGMGFGEEQVMGAGLRPGLETGASVPQLDSDADCVCFGRSGNVDFAVCRGPGKGQTRGLCVWRG